MLGRPGSEPFALNQRAGGASGSKYFFMAVGDGAPERNDVFALSAEDRGTSVRTALCCNAEVDDQAQTPLSARFSEEQRKIREVTVSTFWRSLCSVDVFS